MTRRNEAGLTLMEMLVVTFIVATGFVAAMNTINFGDGNKLRNTAQNITRLCKFAYRNAALNNRYYRLVFDFTEKNYFIEASDEPFYVVQEGDESEEIYRENIENLDEEELAELTSQAGKGDFGEEESDFLDIFDLPGGVVFSDIFVEHQGEQISEGRAFVYFFPRGHTEFAVIHLSDDEGEDFLTLGLHPLTGAVEVYEDYLEKDEVLAKMGLSS